MRIDKYLKLSRLVKRRNVAKVLVDEGSITIGGKVVKPSTEVKVGDILDINLGKHHVVAKVLVVDEKELKRNSDSTFEIIRDEINYK